MKYRVRTIDHGAIGGTTSKISIDGGATWLPVNKFVGGGLVSFDSKAQALKAADKMARSYLAARKAA